MKRAFLVLGIAIAGLPSTAFGYGEGADIPEGARVIHLLTNEARTNTKDALADCGADRCSEGPDCHPEVLAPVYWDDDLFHAAQFHANMLNAIDASDKTPCMQHNSPCTLRDDVASRYPGKCDGSPSCACEGGTATCGTNGTSASQRVKMFAQNYSSENLASTSTPYGAFMLWLYENANGDGCEWSMNNGHRFNILGKSKRIGVGYTEAREGKYYGITSQDFNAIAPEETPALTSGAAYKANKILWFKTHYYSDIPVSRVQVIVDGETYALEKTRGTENNGVYGSNSIVEPLECAEYYFEALDTAGNEVRFPTTGNLLYGCDKSWKKSGGDSESDCSAYGRSPLRGTLVVIFGIFAGILLCLRSRRRQR